MTDLAEMTRRFRAFADVTSHRAPLYATLSGAADDEQLVGLLLVAPEEQHNPVLSFVAVHGLLLRSPPARHVEH